MKKISTLLALLPLASAAFGQITINSTDMPVPTSAYHLRNFSTTTAANPAAGTSATWDYSTYAGTPDSVFYPAETDAFFTAAGIDVYKADFKSLIPGLGYIVFGELDFNTTNVKESGLDVQAQAYSLAAMTGATTDSLTIPAQQQLLSTPKEIVHFPFTANSSWSSSSRRSVNLFLTVAAFSLSHTAIQHVYYVNRKDTIVGWGKMKVYTTSGASIQYDVLMDKIRQYAVDSFYMGGSPAPATLLSGFGMSQGQFTDSSYRYNFYRKSSFNYLLSFNYANDPTYTSTANGGKFMHSDGITPAGVNEIDNAAYATILFPNPANGNEVNLLVDGRDVKGGQYFITDMSGRTIQAGAIEMKQGAVHVALSDALASGNYFINIVDAGNVKIATEQFTVAK